MERTRQQQAARDRAVSTFQHYIRLVLDKAGHSASYTGDTAAEIEGIVDDIIAAATLPERSAHAEAVQSILDGGRRGGDKALRLHDGASVVDVTAEQLPDPRD